MKRKPGRPVTRHLEPKVAEPETTPAVVELVEVPKVEKQEDNTQQMERLLARMESMQAQISDLSKANAKLEAARPSSRVQGRETSLSKEHVLGILDQEPDLDVYYSFNPNRLIQLVPDGNRWNPNTRETESTPSLWMKFEEYFGLGPDLEDANGKIFPRGFGRCNLRQISNVDLEEFGIDRARALARARHDRLVEQGDPVRIRREDEFFKLIRAHYDILWQHQGLSAELARRQTLAPEGAHKGGKLAGIPAKEEVLVEA